jgi:hypothetical protein
MLGWLAKRAENSRVYMCIKEAKWELEAATIVKRATILALAQLLRGQMVAHTDFPRDVLNRPLDYPRDQLLEVYKIFETIRNQNALSINATKESLRRVGLGLPQFSEDHAKNTGRGIEVWMCTVGAGICPDRREDVRSIWRYLSGATPQLGDAISQLREVEYKTMEMTGSSSDQMFGLSDREWSDFCRFVPEAFAKNIPF